MGDGEVWLDPSVGSWLHLDESFEWGNVPNKVRHLVPSTFEAYARIFHPIGIEGREWSWGALAENRGFALRPTTQITEVLDYEDGPEGRGRYVGEWSYQMSRLQWHELGPILREHTTSDAFVVGVWEGIGSLPPRLPTAPLELPHGSYYLIGIPQARWHSSRVIGNLPPFLVWPEDRTWFLGGWLEATSTYVGGSQELIAEILEHIDVETAEAHLDDDVVLI